MAMFGELHSLKWRFEANGGCRIVLFDEESGSEYEFTGATMEEAFRNAQSGIEATFPQLAPGLHLCFSGAFMYLNDSN